MAFSHFSESFSGFASRIRSRAAKPAKYENLWVFIRFDAHVVNAGINLRGCGPLTTPWVFLQAKKWLSATFFYFLISLRYSVGGSP